MRIVVSSEDDSGLESPVAGHFGRCPFFVVAEVGDDVGETRVVSNPFHGSHRPGAVPGLVRDMGADVMIAGGMGARAVGMFESAGIRCVTGASGTVGSAIRDFLEGRLSGTEPCREGGQHHGGGCGGHGGGSPS